MSETDDKLQEKLLDYLQDAHAMETNVLQMLDSMIANTDDEMTLEMLTHHREETERHEARLAARLDALGAGSSARKQAQSVIGGAMKSMVDSMRGDKPGKNARDGFMTEHVEIAAYELLERLAMRAGDTETAEIARSNRRDEEAMAQKIAASWDHVVDLTLAEAGVTSAR
jgi:ferritin-like metal-binding protein YciE